MNTVVIVSFLVLTISMRHFVVSGQYIPYNANAQVAKSTDDRQTETATSEYEYYDDITEDLSTTQSIPTTRATRTTTPTTTTTSTTTPKPITSYRVLTTHRNGFRPINSKKKFDTTTKQQYQPDSYTEASNESAFIQQKHQVQTPPPHLRNVIADINRRTSGKEYAQEKSLATSIESNNGDGNGNANYFSRRYARFLFKSRSG